MRKVTNRFAAVIMVLLMILLYPSICYIRVYKPSE